MEAKQFYSTAEFAKAIGVKYCRVESWLQRGAVRCKEFPRGTKMVNRRFTHAEVERVRRLMERGLPI